MKLRERFLDAIIDGQLGKGLVVTRQEFMQHFQSYNAATTGVFLSNSEMETGILHSPTYTHFTQRISEGVYRVHPSALVTRMNGRGI